MVASCTRTASSSGRIKWAGSVGEYLNVRGAYLNGGGEWDWDGLFVEFTSYGFNPESFWDITPKELRLLTEATARRLEREHNSQAWHTWHLAALQRQKRLPDLKKLLSGRTYQFRQNWKQQLEIMSKWAAEHNEFVKRRDELLRRQKELGDGR